MLLGISFPSFDLFYVVFRHWWFHKNEIKYKLRWSLCYFKCQSRLILHWIPRKKIGNIFSVPESPTIKLHNHHEINISDRKKKKMVQSHRILNILNNDRIQKLKPQTFTCIWNLRLWTNNQTLFRSVNVLWRVQHLSHT